MKYAWIFATIGAIVAGVLLWRGRDRPADPPAPPAARDSAATSPDAGARAAAPPPPPRQVTPAPAPGTPPAPAEVAPAPGVGADSLPYDREARDPGWAVDQERELRVRLDHVSELLAAKGAKVDVVAAECRTTQCRFELAAGADTDLSALYGLLETPDGLYGWADAVVLGEIERDPATGGLTTSVTAVFEREP